MVLSNPRETRAIAVGRKSTTILRRGSKVSPQPREPANKTPLITGLPIQCRTGFRRDDRRETAVILLLGRLSSVRACCESNNMRTHFFVCFVTAPEPGKRDDLVCDSTKSPERFCGYCLIRNEKRVVAYVPVGLRIGNSWRVT